MNGNPPAAAPARLQFPENQIPMTRTQALLKMGFFQFIDVIFILLFLTAVGFFVYHSLQADQDLRWTLISLFASCVVLGTWAVVLAFRCMSFVLDMMADINLMPEAAARIVAGFYASGPGGKLPPPLTQP
jgi:protein-S-isoprenylcysteine O-methyltransferase Ste14